MSNETIDRKAALYARVSSKDQEKEGFSIPAQTRLLHDYARTHSLYLKKEYIEVETAKASGREKFGELLAYFEKNPDVRVLLVEKIDRLYRNFHDCVLVERLIKERGVEVHFVKEGEILSRESSSHTTLMHDLKLALAKNYIANLSEEIRKGMREKVEQGYYPAKAPLGYENIVHDGKKIIKPDIEIAPLIKKLYEWYSTDRYSLQKLVEKAFQEGLVYRRSRSKIHKSVIHKILRNPLYYGDFEWKGRLYKGNHESIVSKPLWDSVQDVLNGKRGHDAKPRKRQWAFQGLVRCGHCGCLLTAEIKKNKYVYYHCTGHRGHCPEKYVREEELAQQFGEAIERIRIEGSTLSWVIKALRESHADEKKYHDETIAALTSKLQKLQDRIDQMYVDKLDGNISSDFFTRKSSEWNSEQDEILCSIERHKGASRNYIEDGVRILELAQSAARLYKRQDMSEKRKLVDFVFSNSIWKGGKLEPKFREPFDRLAITNTMEMQRSDGKYSNNIDSELWYSRQDSNLRPSA